MHNERPGKNRTFDSSRLLSLADPLSPGRPVKKHF